MAQIMFVLYVGLLIFALNGLQLMALRQKAAQLKLAEERLTRILLKRRRY